MAENDNARAVMAGLFGAALGLGAGVMMASKSGEDVRKDIKLRADEAKDTADTIASRAKKKWNELREEIKRDLEAKKGARADMNEQTADEMTLDR